MKSHQFGYAKLDQPGVTQLLFHPRKEVDSKPPPSAIDYDIIVEEDVQVGARFHMAGAEDPNILFFHGNGEIVSDYDSIGPMYNEHGLSLLAVDYRGYGRSGGVPTVTSMMRDAHVIFKEVQHWLQDAKRAGPLVVMGRSLGSACAIELAASDQADISGVIIESGFAHTVDRTDCQTNSYHPCPVRPVCSCDECRNLKRSMCCAQQRISHDTRCRSQHRYATRWQGVL